ncbi:MAG: hypothetical protein N2646_05670 [Bellilinea sp.]|nr:hypothetical protein [Bellilinea sp.]
MPLSDELRLFLCLLVLVIFYCCVIWIINIPAYYYRSKIKADPQALTDWLLSPFFLFTRVVFFILLVLTSPILFLLTLPLIPLFILFRKASNWVNRFLEALTDPIKYVIFFQRMIRLGLWMQFIPEKIYWQDLEEGKPRSKSTNG